MLLLVVTTLEIYKPWGLTRYGRRKQQEQHKVEHQLEYKTSLGVRIFYAVIGGLAVLAYLPQF